MSDIAYFGTTDFRGADQRFGIRAKDRLRHVYIIGKTGVGKSTLMENMIAQDIMNGNGVAFLDPHGSSAEKMLDYVPEHRMKDVIYFAPFDVGYPIAFNVLDETDPDKRHHVANGVLSVMKKIWVDAFSGRMEYILQNVMLALLEFPGATLLGINRMLTDKEYRKIVIENIKDPSVLAFWRDEYMKWDDRYQREAGASIQNKVGQFTSNPLIRNIIGQEKSSFDIRDVMDNKKILIANFSKGLLGEQNAQLLGSMLSTRIYLSAMSRAELTPEQMDQAPPFYLFVDEFQNFANDSFADVLSEARKYKLSLTMAHQFIAQMPDVVREAIFGNVGTMISFRIGPEDAEHFAREFSPTFTEEDLTNLGFAQIYLRLMVGGLSSKPFSARTLAPIAKPPVSVKAIAFQNSRHLYANERSDVEAAIDTWYQPIQTKKSLEHQEYIKKKRAEVEASGGKWVDHSKDTVTKGKYEEQKERKKIDSFYAKKPTSPASNASKPIQKIVPKKAIAPSVTTQTPQKKAPSVLHELAAKKARAALESKKQNKNVVLAKASVPTPIAKAVSKKQEPTSMKKDTPKVRAAKNQQAASASTSPFDEIEEMYQEGSIDAFLSKPDIPANKHKEKIPSKESHSKFTKNKKEKPKRFVKNATTSSKQNLRNVLNKITQDKEVPVQKIAAVPQRVRDDIIGKKSKLNNSKTAIKSKTTPQGKSDTGEVAHDVLRDILGV